MKSTQDTGDHPLTSVNAYAVIVSAFRKGFVYPSAHFQKRMRQRRFTDIHARQAVMHGSIHGDGIACPEFNNWKYHLRGYAEGRLLEVIVGLAMDRDFVIEPSIILITGFWIVNGNPKVGARRKRKTEP